MLFPIFVPQGRSQTRFNVGYIHQDGKPAIDPVFIQGTRFCQGMASVQVKGGRWGVIDTTGNFVIQPKLWNWCRFNDGFAALATRAGKWGLIDKTGEYVVQPTYDSIGPFDSGLALVRIGEEKGARFGFIDQTGTELIPLKFHKARHFSQGLAAVQVAHLWGYILASGVFQITPRFDGTGKAKRWPDTRTGSFVDGLAPVWAGQDHYRFIDRTGTFAFEGGFDDANSFSQGRAVVKKGNRYGYINPDGQMAIDCRFTLARDFSESLAKVEVDEPRPGYPSQAGFIDLDGRMVIPPKFRSADGFENGLSLVSTDDSIAYIDRSGQFVWQGPFVDYGVVF